MSLTIGEMDKHVQLIADENQIVIHRSLKRLSRSYSIRVTLLTDMPMGVIKIIPIKLHSIVEWLVAPVLIIGALAFPNLVTGGRGFFVTAGVIIFAVWLVSDYSATTPDYRNP